VQISGNVVKLRAQNPAGNTSRPLQIRYPTWQLLVKTGK
jgi:hypothetical protein